MTRYIFLRKPTDLNTPLKLKEIKSHLNNGVKTNELLLKMNFVATDEVVNNLCNDFRIMKNQIALIIR